MRAARNKIFLLSVLTLSAVFSCAEEVDRPPVDPQPDFVRPVPPADPEAPSVAFDPLRNMKSRKEHKDEARNAAQQLLIEAFLKTFNLAMAEMKEPRLTIYSIRSDRDDHERDPLRTNQHDPANNLFYGWKIVKSVEPKPEGSKEALNYLSNFNSYGAPPAVCFYPGFAFQWKDATHTITVVLCLQCHWAKFNINGTEEVIPLSRRGVFEGYKLYFSYFPDPETEAKIDAQRKIWEQEELKKKKKEGIKP